MKREGHSRLRVLGRDQLTALVEEAVALTLRDRGLLDDTGDLAREASARAEGLMREVHRLEAEREESRREGAALDRRVNELRREVALAEVGIRETLAGAKAEAAVRVPPERAALAHRIRAILAASRADPAGAAERVAAEVEAYAAAQAERAQAGARGGGADRIEDLERRLQKMREALARAEDELRRSGAPSVPGIASIYRRVQGLNPRAPNFSNRRALLEKVFEANVRLQRAFSAGAGGRSPS